MVGDPVLNVGWILPGGGVNKGETLEKGLIREFEEETGLLVEVGPALGNDDRFIIMQTGQPVHAVLHFYQVKLIGGTLLADGNGYDTTVAEYINLETIQPTALNDPVMVFKLLKRSRELPKND